MKAEMSEKIALARPVSTPEPTLMDQLWMKLDGAYARWRRYRRHGPAEMPEGFTLDHMHGRVIGLVQAIAIMSRGVLTEDEVKAECLERWKERQGR